MQTTTNAEAAKAASADAQRLPRKDAWTDREDQQILRASREDWTWQRVSTALAGRTPRAIHNRAQRLRVRINIEGANTPTGAASAQSVAERRNEIRRLCGYMTSDSSISAYLHCEIEEVALVRASIPPSKGTTHALVDGDLSRPVADPFPAQARESSRALLCAMLRHYDDVADRLNRTPTFAMHACLFGMAKAEKFAAGAQAA